MGEMDTFEALKKARELGLDLVEVAPNANPPVCRIMDYSRFLYEEKKKEKKAKKHQQTGMKEMVFHPKIDTNDYNVKLKKIKQFFKSVPRVKIEIRRLWITRINAACRINGISYSRFIHGLGLAGIKVDRKVLADIAVKEPEVFAHLVEASRDALNGNR